MTYLERLQALRDDLNRTRFDAQTLASYTLGHQASYGVVLDIDEALSKINNEIDRIIRLEAA